MAERTPLLLTGAEARKEGRAEEERPRLGAAAGAGDRLSCALRARNACCSALRPGVAEADRPRACEENICAMAACRALLQCRARGPAAALLPC